MNHLPEWMPPPHPVLQPCPGPLVWFNVDPFPCPTGADHEHAAGILECNTCSFIVVTGNFLDSAHLQTPLLRGT